MSLGRGDVGRGDVGRVVGLVLAALRARGDLSDDGGPVEWGQRVSACVDAVLSSRAEDEPAVPPAEPTRYRPGMEVVFSYSPVMGSTGDEWETTVGELAGDLSGMTDDDVEREVAEAHTFWLLEQVQDNAGWLIRESES